MLLNSLPASSVPATVEPTAVDSACVCAVPLQGRALLAQLEALAQSELVQLAAEHTPISAALPHGLDPALAGLAWDLGLSGEALEAAATGRD